MRPAPARRTRLFLGVVNAQRPPLRPTNPAMNKNLYRLIFNAARGMRMAVSEIASGHGKGRAGGPRSTGVTRKRAVIGAAMATLATAALAACAFAAIALFNSAHAQIAADPGAPGNQRPTVLVAPNGVPLVNIQTPSAAGVSRNTYSQFDVNAPGAILNNARSNAQTQLGGWVQGNPWLAGGAARVILNEVNSSNPSYLRGFVEVAGSRAEVVIANPAGVNINGGGFINASRVTITTGRPVMNGGNLEGYVVSKGLVSVNGAGLDASQTDFTGIIARAVEVNAGIWAKELKVTTGANQVDVAQSSATPIAGSGAAPAFALDVSQLGGMYAGKITMVGTEAGVGVRNAGNLGATAGNVVVTVDGLLQNSGRIAGSAATQLDASSGISNTASGTVYSAGDTSLSTRGYIDNAGQIAAQGNTTLAATGPASQISSVAGSVLAAGLREDGTFAATSSGTGKLTLGATQNIAALGQNLSSGEQSISAASINISGSQTSADSLALTAGAGGVDAGSAAIGVTQALAINTTGLLRTDNATVSAGQLDITAQDMSNVSGDIIQTGLGDTGLTVTGAINNTGGKLASNGNTRISAQSLLNQGGSVQAAGVAHLDITTLAALDNSAGGRLTAGGNATLATGSLSNSLGQIQAGGNLAVTASQAIDNTQGQIAANGTLALTADSLDNTRGTVASIQNSVSLTTTGSTVNDSGRIEAAGNVTLTNAGLSNAMAAGQSTGGSISGQQVSIDTSGQAFNNTGGTVTAGQGATLNTGALTNNAGLIQAGDALLINTHGQALTNTNAASHASGQGGISAQGTVTLQAADIHNAAGFIGAQGALNVTGANINNTAGGQIIGESTVDMAATAFDNRGGQVQALGNVSIDAGTGTINNTASLIRSADTVTLTAAAVTNSNTSGTDQGIEGLNVAITAATIANNSGAIRAGNNATLSSDGSINNSAGLISAGNVATLQDTASAKTLAIANSAGTIIADQGVVVTAASLGGDGKVLSKGDLSVTLTSDFTNSGEITANRNASIETTGTLTNQGNLQAGQGLTVKAGTLNNQATGEIRGNTVKLIATDTNTLTNRGLIDGVETVIETITLNNLGTGRIYGDHVAIGATTVNNLAEGGVAPVIAARNRLDIAATSSINNSEHALIFSGGDMAIGASLDGAKRATGQTGTINNASATIEALGSLTISAAQINNTNNHFSTEVVPVSSTSVSEYQIVGSGSRWTRDQVTIFEDEELVLSTPEGASYWVGFNRYDYTRSISETRVASSDPGQILSGGAMTLNANSVFNDKSRIIAGGALGGSVGSLTNTEAAGERVITDVGSVTNHYRIYRRRSDTWGTSTADYTPANVVQGISLTPTVYQQGTAPVGSGTTLAGVALGSVSGATSAAGTANAAARPGAMVQVNSTVGASTQVVRSLQINTTLPNNSLFRINPSPASNYLVETDPRFASYRTWLSSDYLLGALSIDPNLTQKRLGDGFYEQKLIREQVAQLTGRRFLDGYQSDEAQFQALMQSGVTLAQQHQLRPGIALTAAQMAQLTSDIVWLVERDVTLPDGTVTKALVPQVYVRVKDGDLTGDGALISADAVNFNMSGDLTNSGTIAGRTVVSLNAQNIHNLAGRIRGADVTVAATNDLNNTGGQIIATDSLVASAGRDLNITSTTRSQTGSQGGRNNIDRVAGLYVSNPGGTLVASAGRDANIIAGVISNSGQGGNTEIAARRDLNLGTVTEASNNAIRWDANNFRNDSQSAEVGSQIQATGNIQLSAGNDLSARAAQVSSTQGALTASAGNSINITAGESSQSVDEGHQRTSKGFLSKKTVTTRETMERTDAVGSVFSGNTVTLLAGKDINIKGSTAVSDGGTTLVAGNNINIEAAQNTFSSTSERDEKRSGIFSGGGFSITAGKQQQSTDTTNTRTTAAASTVGSIAGNVTIQAGEAYKQVGSDVLAPGGDISISAKKVDIIEARETSKTVTEQKFSQSGISAGISSPIISAIQGAQGMAQAASQTSDGRMQALAVAATALNLYNNAGQIGDAATALANGDVGSAASLSISVGSSKSQSTSTSQSNTARGSSVKAGGNIAIIATGGGQDSNILIQGSAVEAGKSALLFADNQINILAAKNTSSQTSNNSSSSASIGVSFGAQTGVTVSASKGSGQGNGSDVSYTNSQIKAGSSAGNTVSLISGGDTNLKGAVVAANQVKADIGGNLNIESLQDTSTYTSAQKSAGFSITVGPTGVPTGGGISASKSNIASSFQSVNQQSGIKAGDGGFQVAVKGNTDLKGAVIASTQVAVAQARNTFTTGSLSFSDIRNSASYQGKAAGISVDVGQQAGKFGVSGVGVGIGSDKGEASSISAAGISGIAGNTAVRSTDAETGIKPIFDAAKVQREINAQVAITQAFSKEAPKAVATYAGGKAAELRKQGNEEEAKKWDEGGVYRIALHTAAGALGGGLSGAAGAAVSASAANLMNELQDSMAQGLKTAGMSDAAAKAIAQGVAGLTAAGMGAAVGGAYGAAASATVDMNNRQLHPTEAKIIKDNAAKFAKQLYGTANPTPEQVEAAVALLANTAQSILDNNLGVTVGYSSAADAFLQTLKIEYSQQNGSLNLPGTANQQQLFYATVDQKNQSWLNQGLADSGITGLIVKTPLAPAINNPTNDSTRDRMTGLPLDEKGRYAVSVSVEGKPFEPKYFPCATSSCIASGKNLDMADPGTQAYLKAVDKMIVKDIGAGSTLAAVLLPAGVVGGVASVIGPITSVTVGMMEDQSLKAIFKEGLQAAAGLYIQKIYGFTKELSTRVVGLVDSAGGWEAFVDRVQVEIAKDKK